MQGVRHLPTQRLGARAFRRGRQRGQRRRHHRRRPAHRPPIPTLARKVLRHRAEGVRHHAKVARQQAHFERAVAMPERNVARIAHCHAHRHAHLPPLLLDGGGDHRQLGAVREGAQRQREPIRAAPQDAVGIGPEAGLSQQAARGGRVVAQRGQARIVPAGQGGREQLACRQ
ncbi:hypothetical protein D3C85_1345350 [compost metagenome]